MARHGSYVWNVARLSAGFVFVFMAFNTAQNLESTVVSDNMLVNTSLALLYGVFTFMTIVAPRLVSMMGPKAAIATGAVPYVLLVFANMAPSYSTFLPAFAAVGFGASILWTGQGIYMSRCAVQEAALTKASAESMTSKLNGVFWTAFQFNAAVGLLAASVLFQVMPDFKKAVNFLFLGLGILGCVGLLVLLTVESVPAGAPVADGSDEEEDGEDLGSHASLTQNDHQALHGRKVSDDVGPGAEAGKAAPPPSFYETLRLVYASRAMQLLVPIIFYCGASLGFHFANFPLLYQDVEDANGNVTEQRLVPKAMVGYISATFYLANSAACYAWGKLAPKYGKRPLLVLTLVTHALYFALILALTQSLYGIGHQSAGAYAITFGLSVVFALGDSVLESQIPALVQSPTFFPDERDRDAANSNLRMWQSLGFTVQFAVGIARPKDVFLQACMLAPLLLVAVGAVWALNAFVRPIDTDTGSKGKTYAKVRSAAGGEDEE